MDTEPSRVKGGWYQIKLDVLESVGPVKVGAIAQPSSINAK